MTFEDYLLNSIKEELKIYCEENNLLLKEEDITAIYERTLKKIEINHYKNEWIIEQRKIKLERICKWK